MKLALYQGPSPAGDCAAALARVATWLGAAKAAGASMLVMPELFLPGYNFGGLAEVTEADGADWPEALSRLAREAGCGLTIGYAEQAAGRRYNAALALGPDGACLARYRKIQPFGPREKALFTPGDDLVTFAFAGWRCGLLICYDVEFAPLCKAMADAGTELLLVPTANPDPFDHVCRLTVPSQAVNHGLTIAYANYCGPEEGITYCGGSVIVGPDGVPLATAGRGEALLVTDLAPVRAIPRARLSTQAEDLRWRG